MIQTKISFIGGGNMARSLLGGLIAGGFNPTRLCVADPGEDQRELVQARFGVRAVVSNEEVAQIADVLVLAVKPQILKSVAQSLAPLVQENRPLVISIAAGVRSGDLDRWLGGGVSLVRTMPNTPALVQSGATALYARSEVTAKQRSQAESVMRAVGLTLWVEDEDLLDSVTALSGSGPAYFFLMMEILEQAAIAQGLPKSVSHLLTLQTAFGAAKMALESEEDLSILRARVTSRGGTTERAIEVLESGGLSSLFSSALDAARTRSQELAVILGEEV
ncbi:Pyrroline-5-carboxylate reductase [Gammaproteobacteria bacterium]